MVGIRVRQVGADIFHSLQPTIVRSRYSLYTRFMDSDRRPPFIFTYENLSFCLFSWRLLTAPFAEWEIIFTFRARKKNVVYKCLSRSLGFGPPGIRSVFMVRFTHTISFITHDNGQKSLHHLDVNYKNSYLIRVLIHTLPDVKNHLIPLFFFDYAS